ncbi:MAG: hypothetical protein ACRD27_12520 [Terracidiphilus sp.]
MSSTAWSWLLAIVGTLTSIAGVVFSVLAWVQAKGARKAAQEAAAAVRVRNLSHSFTQWSVDARELLQSVRDLRFESAQRSATDLLGVLAHNKGWQAELRNDAPATGLNEVIRLVGLVNEFLAERTVFEGNQTEIVRHCEAIFRKLREASGKLDAAMEKQ